MDWLHSLVLFLQEPAAGGSAPAAGQPPAAQGGGAVPGCGGQQSLMSILMIVAMIAIFWLLIIRPQQKRQKQHQEMVQNLKRGDRVVTQSGIYGRIVALTPNDVVLDVAKVDGKDVRLRMVRAQIAGPAAAGGEGDKDTTSSNDNPKA